MTQSTEQDSVQEAFERWLGRTHTPAHARRNAARNAAFLLPHLRPGMRLLDAGCGPGSITLGLAEAVAPGEAVGIDRSDGAIDASGALASEKAVPNVRFEVASIYALPFEDASFDAAFVHAVLQHLSEPLRALREVRRVLKPGGVIGVADADYAGSLMHPSSPALEQALDLQIRMREHSGTPPFVGRRLRELLHDAGFPRNAAFVVADCDGALETAQRAGAYWADYFSAPEFVAYVTSSRLASEADLREMSEAWRTWGQHPGAFWGRMWCQAVGWAM
ncbi:MAG: methyltransferase domain-containing protein [Dehalococcoidia bacterium]